MVAVFGAGGCAKELEWLLNDLQEAGGTKTPVDVFVDCNVSRTHFLEKPLVEEEAFFQSNPCGDGLSIFIALGDCFLRKKVFHNITNRISGKPNFPTAIHPSVRADRRQGRFLYGQGNIFCAMSIVMPDVRVGNFNYISLNSIIGHDTDIGDFVTIFPGVRIAGHVKIQDRVLIGTGAIIIENISICSDVIIGAGSVVTRDILEPGTYVGTPAKRIK
jgi:sugar O-acyltransferase (sialic acid O-acetyltransferase NeuD family)